jgi:hypothetical protein
MWELNSRPPDLDLWSAVLPLMKAIRFSRPSTTLPLTINVLPTQQPFDVVCYLSLRGLTGIGAHRIDAGDSDELLQNL